MAEPKTLSSPNPPVALGRNVSFHLLWSSTLASGMGDRLAVMAALAILGYGSAASQQSTLVAGTDFFFFLPYLLWSPFAGWLADRVPRKWLMFIADETRGLAVLAALTLVPVGVAVKDIATNINHPWDINLLFGLTLHATHAWKVWALLLFIGIMAATFVPAKMSLVPNVVGLANLSRANAVVVLMGVIGNLMGLFVFRIIGDQEIRSVIFVGSMCYCVSGTFWIFLKTPWKSAQRTAMRLRDIFTDIRDGAGYAINHRAIMILIIAGALMWAGTSIYAPALGVINVNYFGGDSNSLAVLLGCSGLGMLLGAVLLGFMNPRLGTELLVPLGMFSCGLAITLQMIIPSYPLSLFFSFIVGLSGATLLVPINTLMQRITADYVRGRVFAANELIQEIGKVAISGWIWLAPKSDPYMKPLAITFAIFLILSAALGLKRWALTGHADSPAQNLIYRIARLYATVWHRRHAVGRANMPHTGPVLIVANHTAGIDPVLIQSIVHRPIRFMMAAEYMTFPFAWLWKIVKPIPVTRDGSDRNSARHAIQAINAGQVVGIFPEGGLPEHPAAKPRDFHPGVALIARKTDVPILPVWISGTPHCYSSYTSFLIPSRSSMIIGKPFTASQLMQDSPLDPSSPELSASAQLTARIRDRIAQLAQAAHSPDPLPGAPEAVEKVT